jgi:hypothetical protein
MIALTTTPLELVLKMLVRTTPLHHCGPSYEMDGDPLGLSDNVLEIYK